MPVAHPAAAGCDRRSPASRRRRDTALVFTATVGYDAATGLVAGDGSPARNDERVSKW
jgi:hypothetical protein